VCPPPVCPGTAPFFGLSRLDLQRFATALAAEMRAHAHRLRESGALTSAIPLHERKL
jgi:hypothetical protein